MSQRLPALLVSLVLVASSGASPALAARAVRDRAGVTAQVKGPVRIGPSTGFGKMVAGIKLKTPGFSMRTKTTTKTSFGDRMADKVASVAGSWKFILGASSGMAVWMAYNALSGHPFDAPPYVGLNLVLSTVAALQAPFILMSQNRQGTQDRLRLEEDFQLNTHEQGEIASLHSKIDQLTLHIEKLSETIAKK